MRTQLIGIVMVVGAAQWVGGGCSSSLKAPAKADAAGADAPAGPGGAQAGSGGATVVGTGGTASGSGRDAGAGGSGQDGPKDLPTGTGGKADANHDIATSHGTGGKATGGIPGTGGVYGSGGKTGAGGWTGTGGMVGSGGKTGAGGRTGTGGSGGDGAVGCNYECRTDSSGVTGWYLGSQLITTASCLGCVSLCTNVGSRSESCSALCPAVDGGTGLVANPGIGYANCAQDMTGRLTWQAPQGKSGYGPALVLDPGGGWMTTWNNTPSFEPARAPATNPDGIYKLTSTQVRDLFTRLAAVLGHAEPLPHAGTGGGECSIRFYLQYNAETRPLTLDYAAPSNVAPEMEEVWAWFDQILGAGAWTNPRTYCAF